MTLIESYPTLNLNLNPNPNLNVRSSLTITLKLPSFYHQAKSTELLVEVRHFLLESHLISKKVEKNEVEHTLFSLSLSLSGAQW